MDGSVFAEPVGVVEWRIGENEVGAEIAPESVGLLFAEIGFDAADGEVHHGETARREKWASPSNAHKSVYVSRR